MKVIICYDISDNKIRNKLVKYLKRIAVRVQYSVFIADIPEIEVSRLKEYAVKLLEGKEYGDIAIYGAGSMYLGNNRNQIPDEVIII